MSTAVCCAGSACCSVLCSGCAKLGVPPKNWPKVAYLLQSTFFMGVSVILLYVLRESSNKWSWFKCTEENYHIETAPGPLAGSVISPNNSQITDTLGITSKSNNTESSCQGTSAVLKMSFTLFFFHLLTLLVISPRLKCSSICHDGFWVIKFLLICAMYVGVFFIPQQVFVVWAHICRAGSFIFFCIQAYFLLNMAYGLNDKLLEVASSHASSCE